MSAPSEFAQEDTVPKIASFAFGMMQEEQKVSALCEKLAGYGVDVEALLASIQPEEDEEGEDGDELR
eukprot:1161840-Pelagomonas_calceolata.AAC.21